MEAVRIETEVPPRIVRFAPGGTTLAAVCGLDQLCVIRLDPEPTPLAECSTGIEIGDVAFDPADGSLYAVGCPIDEESGLVEEELAIVRVHNPWRDLAWRRVEPGWFPPFRATAFLPGRERTLYLGAGGAILAYDLDRREAEPVAAEEDDWIGERGLVADPHRPVLAAAWCSQGNVGVTWYRRASGGVLAARNEPTYLRESEIGGAAVSPSGRRLALSHGRGGYLHPDRAGAVEPCGLLSLYDASRRELVARFDVEGELDRDFGPLPLAEGDGRRRRPGSDAEFEFVYVPRSRISNPAFVDDQTVAVGLPGGSIRLIEVTTGRAVRVLDGGSGVGSLDVEPARRRLAAALEGGEVAIWTP